MRVFKSGNIFIIVLEKGDYVLESIKGFAMNYNQKSGFFFGIGAVKNPEIGFYDTSQGRYLKRTLEGGFEVISLLGNLSLDKEKNIIVHAHIGLADEEYRMYGGHLFEAQVSVTMELIFIPTRTIIRRLDEETQLKLMWSTE